jgi:hypothetical protein
MVPVVSIDPLLAVGGGNRPALRTQPPPDAADRGLACCVELRKPL